MAEIPLTRGLVALVDDADRQHVESFGKWHANRRGRSGWYAMATIPESGHVGKMILMHKLLMPGPRVDHINGDGLDNRRVNLRFATQSQNLANLSSYRGSSRYKGVSWHRRNSTWEAYISDRNRKRRLGFFASEEAAARAYNVAALEQWGEYARLNPVADGAGHDGVSPRGKSRPANANLSKQASPASSRYKGVNWESRDQRWRARITVQGRQTHLGVFASEADAARAYNAAALDHWGEYARVNVIDILVRPAVAAGSST